MSLYGEDSRLFFAGFCDLWSQEGSQQGCPLGGLLFILSIRSGRYWESDGSNRRGDKLWRQSGAANEANKAPDSKNKGTDGLQ